MTPSGSVIHWNDSQNSRKHYTYDYSLRIKDANQDQPNEETHSPRYGRVLNVELHALFLCHPVSTPVSSLTSMSMELPYRVYVGVSLGRFD